MKPLAKQYKHLTLTKVVPSLIFQTDKMNEAISKGSLKKDDDITIESKGGVDTYIFDPFNPSNKEINTLDVETIL